MAWEETKERLSESAARLLPSGEGIEAVAIASQVKVGVAGGDVNIALRYPAGEGPTGVGVPDVRTTLLFLVLSDRAVYLCDIAYEGQAWSLARATGVSGIRKRWEMGEVNLKLKRSVPGMPATFEVGDLKLKAGPGLKGDARALVDAASRLGAS